MDLEHWTRRGGDTGTHTVCRTGAGVDSWSAGPGIVDGASGRENEIARASLLFACVLWFWVLVPWPWCHGYQHIAL